MSAVVVAGCDCGFTGRFSSQAYAEHALRLHSCARHERLARARRAHAERMARVDRTPKPCLHKRATHRHGTYLAYTLDACRCAPCCVAVRAYERARVRRNAYGRADFVDAGPVRAHIAALAAAGVGLKRLSLLSGVSTGVLSKVVYRMANRPPTRRMRPATAARILAVQPGAQTLAAGALVDAAGTQAKLRGLLARGWSQSKLAAMLGMEISNFARMLTGARVMASTARRVDALADRLIDQRPPEATHRDRIAASRARTYAAARGWTADLLWCDLDGDDDGAADIDVIAVERATRGEPVALTKQERLEAVRLLLDRGATITRIAETLHVSGATARKLIASARIDLGVAS